MYFGNLLNGSAEHFQFLRYLSNWPLQTVYDFNYDCFFQLIGNRWSSTKVCPTPWLYLWISEPVLQFCCGKWQHFQEEFCYRASLFIVSVNSFIHWAVPIPCITIWSTCKKYKIMIFVFLDFIIILNILRNLVRIFFLFHPYNKSTSWLLLWLPLYRGRNGSIRKLSNWYKITELVNRKSWFLDCGKRIN